MWKVGKAFYLHLDQPRNGEKLGKLSPVSPLSSCALDVELPPEARSWSFSTTSLDPKAQNTSPRGDEHQVLGGAQISETSMQTFLEVHSVRIARHRRVCSYSECTGSE